MNQLLRRLGFIGFALVAGALIVDFLLHREDEQEQLAHSTGLQQFVPGLGSIETAFVGEVEFVIDDFVNENNESSPIYTKILVRGNDPIFADDLMTLPNAEIIQYDLTGETIVYHARSKQAKIFLNNQGVNLKLDQNRTWELEGPTISFPSTSGELVLTTEVLFIDPHNAELSTKNPFTLEGNSFKLASSKLLAKLQSQRFLFGGQGAVSQWSLVSNNQERWSGNFDGRGSLGNHESVFELSFLADKFCRVFAPNDTQVTCSLFNVSANSENGALSFSNAKLGAPCEIVSSKDQRTEDFTLNCNGATPNWNAAGFDGMELQPPINMVFGNRSWANSNGGAWLGQNRDSMIWGGVRGELPSGEFSADSFEREQGIAHASGDVSFANNGANCDDLWHYPDGATELIGRVALDRGDGMAMRANKITIEKSQDLKAIGDVKVELKEEDGTHSTCHADEVDYQSDWHGSGLGAIEARGKVRFDREDVRIVGTSMRLIENTRAELDGWPAQAFLASDPNGAKIVAERFLWENDNIYPSGGPVVRIPAENLGLRKGVVGISAQRMRINTTDGSWQLLGDVLLSGALVGAAQKISGDQSLATMIPGSGEFCFLTGTLENQDFFRLSAGQIEVINGKRVHLIGDAKATLQPKDGKPLNLKGREANFSADGGWFQYNVLLETDSANGKADRISWDAINSQINSFTLTGSASLRDEDANISGHNIRYSVKNSSVFVTGNEFQNANIGFNDSRQVSGEWLNFDLQNRLLSGAKGRLSKDD